MDVIFLFCERAEGVGVVDDGFAVLAPVEEVVRRTVQQQAEAFEVVRLDVAELIIEPRMHRRRYKAVFDQPAIRFVNPAYLKYLFYFECKHLSHLLNGKITRFLKCDYLFLNSHKLLIKYVVLLMKYNALRLCSAVLFIKSDVLFSILVSFFSIVTGCR